tara:strand:+ start:204 stop:398 length:195 start_codon:yes stop_codon:yes gene_type:complete
MDTKQKLDDACMRMLQFNKRYEEGKILQEETKEEFSVLYRQMFMEIIAPLLAQYKIEKIISLKK